MRDTRHPPPWGTTRIQEGRHLSPNVQPSPLIGEPCFCAQEPGGVRWSQHSLGRCGGAGAEPPSTQPLPQTCRRQLSFLVPCPPTGWHRRPCSACPAWLRRGAGTAHGSGLTFACLPVGLQGESHGAAAPHARGRVLARPVAASIVDGTRLWGGKERAAQSPRTEATSSPHPGGVS